MNKNRIEIKTELAMLNAEMRLLGFSEEAINKINDRIINERALDAVWEMIRKYQDANDLYGEAQEWIKED